jgi:predicted  nucleic acid-binding Zn-ribbon protein
VPNKLREIFGDFFMWKDVIKQKPLNMSMMEAAVAMEYGDEEVQQMKSKMESLVPKMPADIKAGYMRAMEWIQSQM